LKLSERILAAKGPIYKDRLKRWAADAKKLEDAIAGGYAHSPDPIMYTSIGTSEAHIVEGV